MPSPQALLEYPSWQTPRVPPVNILTFSAGLIAGIIVTRRLHSDPEAGKWGERLGTTRFRFANLPVGGTIALVGSRVLPRRYRPPVRALGAGALIGATGWALVDPLPPLD